MGRKPSLTTEVLATIVGVIGGGGSLSSAARAAGIGKSTLSRWLALGKAAGAQRCYKDLVTAIDKAEAQLEVTLCKRISDASEHDWKAAAWMLERRFPERWARQGHIAASITTPIIPLNLELRENLLKDKQVQDGVDRLLEMISAEDEKRCIEDERSPLTDE